MSDTQLIKIPLASGQDYGFGLPDSTTGATLIANESHEDWVSWLEERFKFRFHDQRHLWEAVMSLGKQEQFAHTPGMTFRQVGSLLAGGKLQAWRMPLPAMPPEESGGASEGAPASDMRSQQAGNSSNSNSPGSGASESKGAATEGSGPNAEEMQSVGDPVAPATGEEVLTLDDFTVTAPMPLRWQRWYRSRYSNRDIGLGAGWFAECLRLIWQDDDNTWLLDHEARPMRLPLLERGQIAWQAVGGQRLERKPDDRMMLTERDGRVWILAPDGRGQWRPISVQDAMGHQWLFYYDKDMRLARLDLSSRKSLEFAYGEGRELRQISLRQGDERQVLATYGYDANADLVSATTAGGTERYGYREHLLVRRQLATGYHFVFHWDGNGPQARCLRSHGEDGRYDFRFEYWPDKFLTKVTDGFGYEQVYHYDQQERIVARQDADGSVHQWSYDEAGRLASHRLPDGRATYYGYDGYGRPVLERLPDGREHRRTFNPLGFCTAEQLPDGRTLTRRFDPLGRLLRERRADGSEWQYHYDGKGWLSEAVSNTGETRRTGFGPDGELLADENQGILARYAFDEQGRVKGRLVQDLVTEYDYHGDHISAVHQYPEQAPQQRRSRYYGYDEAGRLTTFTAATGERHGFLYQGLARPVGYQRPDGKQVLYQYDKAERLTDVIRADGEKWALSYDSKGQIIACKAPDGRHIEFRYDAAGDIIHREQAGDWVQHLTRDDGGRVLQQSSQGKERRPVGKQFQYDHFGRRTGATCDDRRLAWHYDRQGRITEHRQDQHAVRYGYGPGQRLERIELPDGTVINYDYDRNGRWQAVTVDGDNILQRDFDPQGRELRRQCADNEQLQVWDRHDCLVKRRWQGRTPTLQRYQWDAESRLEHHSDSGTGEHTYQRDLQGQLIAEEDITYAYDDGGNRLGDNAHLSQDRLLEAGNTRRRYDALGAETAVFGSAPEYRTFDAEGQLTELRREGLLLQYGYDALNRRAWRKSEHGTTSYLWHNDVLLGEQHPDGQWQWYIRDPQTDAPLFTLVNGEAYYYELDWRGMPVRLWDPKGKRVWQANADAWGKCQPEGEVHQPIRLPGQFEDELSGLYNNRFRDYDPKTGRYLTPDPLGIKGGLNSYRYTPNPVDYIDPLGLSACGKDSVDADAAGDGELAPIDDNVPTMQEIAGHETLDRAALAALNVANPKSIEDNLEYGGVLYQDTITGRYGYTGPIKGSDQGVNPFEEPVPEGAVLMGDYHAHGDYSTIDPKTGAAIRTSDPMRDDFNSDNFSYTDIEGITNDGKGNDKYRGYLGTPSGKFKRYNPSTRKTDILDD